MNGVTKQIFFLPVPTKMKGDTKIDNNCFKGYLERVFPKDLDTWRDTHLSVNRTVKRKNSCGHRRLFLDGFEHPTRRDDTLYEPLFCLFCITKKQLNCFTASLLRSSLVTMRQFEMRPVY